MPRFRINPAELLGGLAIIVIGAAAWYIGSGYRMGTLRSMGPGMFPVMLSGLFIVMGVLVILEGLKSDLRLPWIPLRPILASGLGIVLFALTVTRWGILPAIFLLVGCIAVGEYHRSWKQILITLGILCLVSVVTLTLVPGIFNLRLVR